MNTTDAADLALVTNDVRAYLEQYVTFVTDDQSTVVALWSIATHFWPEVDAFPYLAITADTKRAGKTRLSELIGFIASNPFPVAGATAAALFRAVRDEQPTLIIDESESLASEAADTMRAFLNVGYRRGQSIPRVGKKGVEQWPAYCPKVFIAIGDVMDTLRDRCIIIRLHRGTPRERFLYEIAKADGHALRERISDMVTRRKDDILSAYMGSEQLTFLNDRDAEIWLPLFAIAEAVAPSLIPDLTRMAVDIAVEKTAPKRSYVASGGAEMAAQDNEYKVRLVNDLLRVMKPTEAQLGTAELLARLFEEPTMPWRRFRGEGLNPYMMGDMLGQFQVKPRNIRDGKGRKAKVIKGYRREDIAAAAHRANGTTPPPL